MSLPIRRRFWMRVDLKKYPTNKNYQTLYAFYDLSVAGITFDFITFLVLAENFRMNKNCRFLHVLIIPGLDNGVSPKDLKTYQKLSVDLKNATNNYLEWRLRNIVVPACWLVPSCKGITVFTTRDEALAFEISFVEYRFPEIYSVRYPIGYKNFKDIIILAKQGAIIPSIAATPQSVQFIKEWLEINTGTRKTIVITFRESTYEVDRNSNLNEWGKFIQNLDTSEFCPIIVRDTETAFEPLSREFEKAIQFPEVCFNVELRTALYESCYINMTINCGPLNLCLLNKKIRYIAFKLIMPTCGATTKEYYQSLGIEPGTQPEICGPFQKWVWEDDTFEVLYREFHEMVEKIDNSVKNME
jgi:hypothetical protein